MLSSRKRYVSSLRYRRRSVRAKLITIKKQFKKFVLSSSATEQHHKTSDFPVLSLPISESRNLRPLMLLYRKNLYFATIPLATSSSSSTFCLLHEISTLASSTKKMEELHWLLTSMLPFGTPVQTGTRAIKSMHYVSSSSSSSSSTNQHQQQQKRPLWKPLLHHTSSSSSSSSPLLSLSVREELRVVQYSKMEDYVDVSGTIMCRADMNGVPTLTIPLENSNRAEYIYMHECCVKKSVKSTKLTCCPPSGRFTLCTFELFRVVCVSMMLLHSQFKHQQVRIN